jgi:hypothetical protein
VLIYIWCIVYQYCTTRGICLTTYITQLYIQSSVFVGWKFKQGNKEKALVIFNVHKPIPNLSWLLMAYVYFEEVINPIDILFVFFQ